MSPEQGVLEFGSASPESPRNPAWIEDERARRAAVTQFDSPLALEAGAGTGKTATLVARVVAWCLGPGWERAQAHFAQDSSAGEEAIAARVLSRTVAITFTESAAAEMSQRVGAALVDVEAGREPVGMQGGLSEDRERLGDRARALLGALDLLSLHTIHAYCRRLLSENALAAGLHPFFEIDASQEATATIAHEVSEERLRNAYGPSGDPAYLSLAARGIGPAQIEDALRDWLACGAPADALAEDATSARAAEAALGSLGESLDAFFRAEAGRLRAVSARATTTVATLDVLDFLRARLKEIGVPDDRSELADLLVGLRERCSDSVVSRLREWGRGKFGTTERACLEGERADLEAAALALAVRLDHWRKLDLEGLECARRALAPLVEEARERLRVSGTQTYDALLRDAHDLLTKHAAVAARVRSGMDQLLVDEFQDTDRLQCEIVRALALCGPEAERPALFLVGDPKQSIYGWRNADLAAYDGFLESVRKEGGAVHRLSVNRRSLPAILEEVERVIAPVMRPRFGVQPAFEPLLPARPDGDACAVEQWISWPWDVDASEPEPDASAGRVALLEAGALARDLAAVHAAGTDWREMAVLFRNRGDLDVYLGALREAGVPYAVENDRSYYRRREIIDAAALVRSVLDPHDHTALLTWLRSPWVGVPDAAWIPLWSEGFPDRVASIEDLESACDAELRAVIERVEAELPGVPGLDRIAGWHESLLAGLRALGITRRAYRTQSADRFVETLRTEFALEVSEAARHVGRFRLSNLERFFRELVVSLEQPPGAVARELRRRVGRDAMADEGRPAESAEDAVRVMTIHAAKGLDFEHVYVMQTHKSAAVGSRDLVLWGEVDRQSEYRLFGYATLGFDAVRQHRDELEKAEMARTLYVALTRAKNRLVVSGAWPRGNAKPNAVERSHADLLARREAAPDLAERMRELARGGECQETDADGIRWKFPALEAASGAPRVALGLQGQLASAEVADFHAKQLAADRAWSIERESKPLGAAASAEHGESPVVAASVSGGAGPWAREVGTAVHRALEHFDFAADPEDEIARARAGLELSLRRQVPADSLADAHAAAVRIFDRFAGGALFERFRAIAPKVVARELPVLLPVRADDAALGYIAGAIDLLHRDPETDAWVIVDYKTDFVADASHLEEHANVYAGQAAVYGRAVAEALGLSEAPRFELWFLALGARVTLPPRGETPLR